MNEEIGRPVGLEEEKVRQALDPRQNVEARSHDGGPAPAAVAKAIDRSRRLVEKDRQRVKRVQETISTARDALRHTAREMIEQR
jgi:argininosuccinate lyase